eukprot:g311.t1
MKLERECIVCTETIKHWVIGECNHAVLCSRCALNLRFLREDKKCVFCKTELQRVIVSSHLPTIVGRLVKQRRLETGEDYEDEEEEGGGGEAGAESKVIDIFRSVEEYDDIDCFGSFQLWGDSGPGLVPHLKTGLIFHLLNQTDRKHRLELLFLMKMVCFAPKKTLLVCGDCTTNDDEAATTAQFFLGKQQSTKTSKSKNRKKGGKKKNSGDAKDGPMSYRFPHKCLEVFQSLKQFKKHLRNDHNPSLNICQVCYDSKRFFLQDLPRYTDRQLKAHIRGGGKMRDGFSDGHPMCTFPSCRPKRFFDQQALIEHMCREHWTCQLCGPLDDAGNRDYYETYNDLEAHFLKRHFLCQHKICMEQKFIVFRTLTDLQIHFATVHPNSNFQETCTYYCGGGSSSKTRGSGLDRKHHPLDNILNSNSSSGNNSRPGALQLNLRYRGTRRDKDLLMEESRQQQRQRQDDGRRQRRRGGRRGDDRSEGLGDDGDEEDDGLDENDGNEVFANEDGLTVMRLASHGDRVALLSGGGGGGNSRGDSSSSSSTLAEDFPTLSAIASAANQRMEYMTGKSNKNQQRARNTLTSSSSNNSNGNWASRGNSSHHNTYGPKTFTPTDFPSLSTGSGGFSNNNYGSEKMKNQNNFPAFSSSSSASNNNNKLSRNERRARAKQNKKKKEEEENRIAKREREAKDRLFFGSSSSYFTNVASTTNDDTGGDQWVAIEGGGGGEFSGLSKTSTKKNKMKIDNSFYVSQDSGDEGHHEKSVDFFPSFGQTQSSNNGKTTTSTQIQKSTTDLSTDLSSTGNGRGSTSKHTMRKLERKMLRSVGKKKFATDRFHQMTTSSKASSNTSSTQMSFKSKFQDDEEEEFWAVGEKSSKKKASKKKNQSKKDRKKKNNSKSLDNVTKNGTGPGGERKKGKREVEGAIPTPVVANNTSSSGDSKALKWGNKENPNSLFSGDPSLSSVSSSSSLSNNNGGGTINHFPSFGMESESEGQQKKHVSSKTISGQSASRTLLQQRIMTVLQRSNTSAGLGSNADPTRRFQKFVSICNGLASGKLCAEDFYESILDYIPDLYDLHSIFPELIASLNNRALRDKLKGIHRQ